ncbi:MAG: hypothetical protein HZC54_14375 [Verrucomicrobia bacterium]|nr:hypothetical protein [Verrucomicrobiota bacterium]
MSRAPASQPDRLRNPANDGPFTGDFNDPRPSLDGRYASKEAWLARVTEALQQLIKQGCLQAEDLDPLQKQAAVRWDWVTKRKPL